MATAPREHTAPVAWRENTRTKELPDEDLLTRTSWVDARTAHRQVKRRKADGNLCALWLRMHMQQQLQSLGSFIQKNCGKVLVVGLILLSLCCVGLKTAVLETNVQELWVEAGGRLQSELAYTDEVLGEGSGMTSELVIQTPKDGGSVLDVESMLLHYEALKAATKITVEMDDKTWHFRDLCMTTNFPSFENHIFDVAIEKLLPCIIITPLDCFWEGSKLLGPDYPAYIPYYGYDITWKNLNPLGLVQSLNESGMAGDLPVEHIRQLMQRAGISSAYQEKPCLDPTDPECPLTAPNKRSATPPAVAAEMTGGCSGFAARYMQWQEDLIIGGAEKNKTGHLIRADAIQSVLQLMGEQELYEFHRGTSKVDSRDWSVDKARLILQSWQRHFTQGVSRVGNASNPDDIFPFSATSLIDILQDFSQISTIRVAMGYVLMVIYACVSMLKWSDAIQSQSGIGIAGVLLVALSVAAGLGMCSVIGVKFNASTTQILPFLALGIGVDDMFLIAHAYAENANRPDIIYVDQTAETLKRTGVSVMVTSLSNMAAFFMAAIIPIPALRSFALQAAILVIFNCVTLLVVYPAIISIDLIRREEKKMDVFCCFTGAGADTVVELTPQAPAPLPQYREPSPPPPYSFPLTPQPGLYNSITHTAPDGSQPTTTLSPGLPCAVPEELPGNYRPRTPNNNAVWPLQPPPSTTSSRQCLAPDGASGCHRHCGGPVSGGCSKWSLTWFAREIYAPQLEKTWIKVFIVIGFMALLVFGIIGITRVVDGLDLTDIVPRETQEYKFLEAQDKYFGFYHMYAVTKREFDYASPEGQKLLLDYHQGFQHVQPIIKKEDGTLPDFWLQLLKDWLLDLQEEFDDAMVRGNLSTNRWFYNASDQAVLAYKLMVQTGDIDSPFDHDRILHGRLVEDDGTINRYAFYNYLSAWASNDALAYTASMANLHPLPKEWFHLAGDPELRIPKSQPIIYAQIPFYLNNMGDTEAITTCISKIRSICDEFVDRGLPNYPSGVPFTYWEQYLNLRLYLGLSLLAVLVAIFLVITCVLANPWTALLVVLVLTMLVVELFGFMGLVGIKLSAVPAVVMIVAVGIGVEFTVHIVLGFLTSIGPSNHRMAMALEHMFAPVIHGAISTLLGVIMLATAEFDFIVKYFFLVLTALVFLGLLNGLVLLPVLLSIIGPRAEVIPHDGGYQIDPPTPEPSPQPARIWRGAGRRVAPNRRHSDCSLSTITEEPTQYSSHEIIVHPEVTVETTSVPGIHGGGRNGTPSSTSYSSGHPSGSTVTTVTATAKLKVEVHTPVPGCVDPEHTYKSRKRKSPKDAEFSEESVSEC